VNAASRARALVFGKTIGLVGAYVLAIWDVRTHIVNLSIAPGLLPLATAFVIVQSAVIGVLVAALVGRTLASELQERRAGRFQPSILEALAEHAAGADRSTEIRRWYGRHATHVERCFVRILPTIAGAGRDRLSQLAVHLGMVARWERRSRSGRIATRRAAIGSLGLVSGNGRLPRLLSAFDDPDPEVRLDAACGALRHSPDRTVVERVFAFATRAPFLARAIVAEELRPYASALAERVIPDGLQSGDRHQVLITLEIMEAWGRALPAPHVFALVRDADPAVRASALRVLPLVAGAADRLPEIVARLADDDPRVRAAAAFVGGRLLTTSDEGALAGCLRDPHLEVALAAGFALAELGRTGVEMLEREAVSPDRPAATTALEALERVRIGRCDYARS